MFRFLLSALSIFVLVSSSLLMPGVASACPVRDPETLLSLYQNSEFIYVGTYDKTEDGAPTEDTEDYTVVPIKKHFTISSSLKGQSRKFLVLEDIEYRYKNEAPAAEEAAESEVEDGEEAKSEDTEDADHESAEEEAEEFEADSENGYTFRPLKPGDSVLLFLDRAGVDDVDEDTEEGSDSVEKKTSVEDDDRLELSDEPYGLKNLKPDELSAYEARIKELNGIFGSKDPTHAEIVAWLVRCAENPFTRWEGTFELLRSYTRLEWMEERAKELREQAEEGANESKEKSEEVSVDDSESELTERFSTGDPGFAKALSDAQKQALTNILINRGKSNARETNSRSNVNVPGDRELIDLIGRWGDSAVAEKLVERMIDQTDNGFSSNLMETIASILKDEELSSISDRYSEIEWREDKEVVEEEAEQQAKVEESGAASGDEQATATPAIESAKEVSDESKEIQAENDSDTNAVAPAAPPTQVKKQTYGELRAELLSQFKARASKLVTKERDRKPAKLNP